METTERLARVVSFNRGSLNLYLTDLLTGEQVILNRTSFWDLGAPPGVGALIELVLHDGRLIGGRYPRNPQVAAYPPGGVLLPPQNPVVSGPVVFLAGPIQGAVDWQLAATEYLRKDPRLSHVHVASPRGPALCDDLHYEAQVNWESKWLQRASIFGAILFWLAKESEHFCHRAYAQTSRWELSEWKERLRYPHAPLFVGIEEGFSGERYARLRLKQDLPQLQVHTSLTALLEQTAAYVHRRWPLPDAKWEAEPPNPEAELPNPEAGCTCGHWHANHVNQTGRCRGTVREDCYCPSFRRRT